MIWLFKFWYIWLKVVGEGLLFKLVFGVVRGLFMICNNCLFIGWFGILIVIDDKFLEIFWYR